MSDPDRTPIPETDSAAGVPTPARRDLSGSLLGDFEVERLLGHGGMGEVYLARQISLDRPIALKVLKPELLAKPTNLARFEKEALSAAKLSHPNIVHVYTLGGVDGIRFIAMEYVAGTNLKEYMAKKGVPELPLALSILRQAGAALAAAGEIGLIHRDIKPENLLLTRRGQVKVADFGLCRTTTSSAMDLTQDGVTLGTPMYMSPEQVQGHELDQRSDLYSLGVTAYHMLAGVPPYRAETALALAIKHVRDTPVDLAVHRPDLPKPVVQLVMKLMARAPADRYQSATEMLRDLARIRESLAGSAPTVVTAPVATQDLPVAPVRIPVEAPPTAPVDETPKVQWKRELLTGRHTRRLLLISVVLATLSGALLGVSQRTANLLSANQPPPAGPAALWLADWESIPAAGTPQDQYEYAQLYAPDSERAAAWLAVPGRFPASDPLQNQAYIQLARTLFRHADRDRLTSLGASLADSSQPAEQALARVVQAALAALQNQPEGVLEPFQTIQFELQDPALNALGLEVSEYALRALDESEGTIATRLSQLRESLAEALGILPLMQSGLLETG